MVKSFRIRNNSYTNDGVFGEHLGNLMDSGWERENKACGMWNGWWTEWNLFWKHMVDGW